MNYQLEKYTGKNSRHQCPKCNDHYSFAYYIDDAGKVLDKSVGRCNHESGCGYHYTPKQYFLDNPKQSDERPKYIQMVKPQPIKKEPSYIPFSFVKRCASYNNTLVEFLCGLFERFKLESTLVRLMEDYAIGSTKDQSIIYWQIDIQGKVRTGKVMKYDRNTGHRIKDCGGINWIHSLMKKSGALPEDYNLIQCLFGEHLLKVYPTKAIALVEAEKTALIGATVYPDYIWLATGGKSQMSIDKLKILSGRTVIMFPDVDGFNEWTERAKNITFAKVIVSDILEKNATDEERAAKIDLADWIIKSFEYSPLQIKAELSKAEKTLAAMEGKNPLMRLLIDAFSLVVV